MEGNGKCSLIRLRQGSKHRKEEQQGQKMASGRGADTGRGRLLFGD